MTFGKMIDPAIFSGRNNPGNVVPAIPDGMVLVTELPNVKSYHSGPNLRLEYDNGHLTYGVLYALRPHEIRKQMLFDEDRLALREMVAKLIDGVTTEDVMDLVDFHRDLCFWNN
ncbi:gp078 [Rhodococcus phage ReqiPepy6]|uniref:Gp078 n=1 Tax=Rhodococcus phage ReqiPepy6 TaxID=691965 RepID=D4P7I9_9CAUD|nr:gp078 [Rhodococcus phage ReqiPepy6]ADD80969.1 gp078 [Rhodococcus phage ReqiPepy6]